MRRFAAWWCLALVVTSCTTSGGVTPTDVGVTIDRSGDAGWILSQTTSELGVCLQLTLVVQPAGSFGRAGCEDEAVTAAYYRDATDDRRYIWGRIAESGSRVEIAEASADIITSDLPGDGGLLFVIETSQATPPEVIATAASGAEQTIVATRIASRP